MPTDDPNKMPPPVGTFSAKATLPSSSRYGAGAPTDEKQTRQIKAADPESPAYGPAILEKLEAVLTAQGNMSSAVTEFGARMTNVEETVKAAVGRIAILETGSHRKYSGEIEAVTGEVRTASQANMQNAAAISQVVVDVTELKKDMTSMKVVNAEQLKILRAVFVEAQQWTVKLTAAWNSTPVKIVRWVIGAGLVGWAAKNNIHIGSP